MLLMKKSRTNILRGKTMYLKKTLIFCTLLLVSFINISNARQIIFKGTVVDSEDRPIAGAKAQLYRISYAYTGYCFNFEDIIEKTSSVDGTFAFTLEVADDAHDDYPSWFIVVEKEEYALDCVRWNIGNPEAEAKFTLDSPVELSGTVVDRGGRPVSGSSVNILMIESKTRYKHSLNFIAGPEIFNTITDEKGKFTFNNMSSGFGVALIVKKEGRAAVSSYIPGSPLSEHYKYSPGQDNIRIVQPEESRIEGVAIDKSSGKPLAGIPLMLRWNNNTEVIGQDIITTDENGQFSMTGICAGTYSIFCVPPRYKSSDWLALPVNIDIETGQTREGMQVMLTKGGLLEVLVIDSGTNKPLECATVLYEDQYFEGYYARYTDKDGLARIRLLPGVYEFWRVDMDGYTTFQERKRITIEDGKTEHFEVQLSSMPNPRGVVRDENGMPLKGVQLCVLSRGGEVKFTKSDEEGRFEISEDIYTFFEGHQNPLLVCRYEERNLAKAVILEGNTDKPDIKLEPGITLTGKVTDLESKGIKDADVVMLLSHAIWSSVFLKGYVKKTDAKGNFTVNAIPAGYDYEIIINADGYGSQRRNFHTDDAVDNKFDSGIFTLPFASLSISGVVVDGEGNPIPNVVVRSYNHEGGQPLDLDTQADSKGKFVLNGVCEGKVNIRVDTSVNGKSVSAHAIADGGTSDIKIVVREGGRYVTQRFTNKTYEQIIQESEIVIAGIVVDENDSPVSGVSVIVNCIKRERDDAPGKFEWSFSDYEHLSGTSDKYGRFVIVIEEDVQYDLLFSPIKYAAMLVYDVPAGKQDLKVVLSKGGSISGKLLRMEGDKKIPIPNVQVKIEQSDRAKYVYLGYDQNKRTTTDSQGRFKFEHIQTKIRPNESMSKSEWEYVPRVWQLVYSDNSKTFAFYNGSVIEDYEFIIGLDLADTRRLKGNALPDFEGINIEFDKEKTKDKALLLCFFDIEQRPSRNDIIELGKKVNELRSKNVEIVAIHTSNIEQEYLDKWLKEYDIYFSTGLIETNVEQIKFNWGVKALPWLILTDKEHLVRVEGFAINELDDIIKSADID
ncbi:MAG: redoxin domain-containing protein [Sedimentisphaerales bacterium]|nr:redoxin domain-containing protein [Sedimentisphaerales bacterium]